MKKVCVVMAAYNGEKYIQEQVNSILDQKLFDKFQLESLLIVDDKSSSDMTKIYDSLRESSPLVKIFWNSKNYGVVRTFEKAIKIATESDVEYIALADQDDFWYPDKLLKTLTKLNETDSSLAYTDLCVTNDSLLITSRSKWLFSKTPPLEKDCLMPMLIKSPVTGCTLVFTKELALSALPFPEGIPMHDRWLACVSAVEEKVCYLNEPTMLYRQHSNNEVGGLPFGILGFFKRLEKDANGSFDQYLLNRLKKRVNILRNLDSYEHQKLLIDFYCSSRVKKICRSIWYFNFIRREARVLGLLNLTIDFFLTISTKSLDYEA